MNERILELAIQANSHHNFSDLNYRELDVFLEKFAELIVRECLKECQSEMDCREIRKKFGVEE